MPALQPDTVCRWIEGIGDVDDGNVVAASTTTWIEGWEGVRRGRGEVGCRRAEQPTQSTRISLSMSGARSYRPSPPLGWVWREDWPSEPTPSLCFALLSLEHPGSPGRCSHGSSSPNRFKSTDQRVRRACERTIMVWRGGEERWRRKQESRQLGGHED
jgi:hypothetical protein